MSSFLFPSKSEGSKINLFLLSLRLLFGILLLTHGLSKWNNYDNLVTSFPDPLNIGSVMSLNLAIFAEVFCSIGFIFGICSRLALIPMITTMAVAFFVIHKDDPFAVKELAFIYLVVFILIYTMGAGKYSIDYQIGKTLGTRRRRSGR